MSSNLVARMRNIFLMGCTLCFTAPAFAGFWDTLNLPVGVTEVSKQVYDLHMLIFWICVAIGVVVFGAMFYSMYHHRKSRGAVADTNMTHSNKLEILWTIVPTLILIVMAVPATKVLIEMEDTTKTEMTVKITGYQWRWQYDYLDEGISFVSGLATPREQIYDLQEKSEHYLLEVDKPLVLPVDTRIRLLATAADVIHAWWVPDLGWKRDAIPGFVTDNWTKIDKPGTYRGQCTELCGKDHGFMPIVVEAVSKEDYQKWVAEQKNAQAAANAPQPKAAPVLANELSAPEVAAVIEQQAADATKPATADSGNVLQ